MLIGRDSELLRLRQTILDRRSLLLHGKRGSGKTALLTVTLQTLPEAVRKECIVCETKDTPHALLREMSRAFAAAGDRQLLSRVEKEGESGAGFERWLLSQTSLRLRGILRLAARERHYSIFLDAASRLPDGIYRLLQEWVWSGRTPVVIVACASQQHELGRTNRLFWHQGLRMELGPLSPHAASELLEACVIRCGLLRVAGEEFRQFVLQESGCLPGAIVLLCEMAKDPAYCFGNRIKLNTLRIDFHLRESALAPATLRATDHG